MAWEDGETGYKDPNKVPWKFIILMAIIAAFVGAIIYCVK